MIVKSSYSQAFGKSPRTFGLIDKFISLNVIPIDGHVAFINNISKETLEDLEKQKFLTSPQREVLEKIIRSRRYATRPVSYRSLLDIRHKTISLGANISANPGFYDTNCIANFLGGGGITSIVEAIGAADKISSAMRIAEGYERTFALNGKVLLENKTYSKIYTYKLYKIKDTRGKERIVKIKKMPEINENKTDFKSQTFINFVPEDKYENLKGSIEQDFFPSAAHYIVGNCFKTEPVNDPSGKKKKQYSSNLQDFSKTKYQKLKTIEKYIKKPLNLSESEEEEDTFYKNLACAGTTNSKIVLLFNTNNINYKKNAIIKPYKTNAQSRSLFGPRAKNARSGNSNMNYYPEVKFVAGPYSLTSYSTSNVGGTVSIGGIINSILSVNYPSDSFFYACSYVKPVLYAYFDTNIISNGIICDNGGGPGGGGSAGAGVGIGNVEERSTDIMVPNWSSKFLFKRK